MLFDIAKYGVLTCVISLTLVVSGGHAIDLESIYVVDFKRVIDESSAVKDARSRIEKNIASERSKLENRGKKLQAMKSDLQRQAAVLSESVLADRAKEAKAFEKDLVQDARNFEDSIQSRNARVLEAVADKTREVVEDLAEDESIDFILLKQSRSVVYSSDKIDITSKVLARLEKENFSLDIK